MKIFFFTAANVSASLPPAIRNLPIAEIAGCFPADSAFINTLTVLTDVFNGCRDLQKGCQQGANGILKCAVQFVVAFTKDEIVEFASNMIF